VPAHQGVNVIISSQFWQFQALGMLHLSSQNPRNFVFFSENRQSFDQKVMAITLKKRQKM
jgi:hypothetical protein